MATENKFERCERDDDPNRCQGNMKHNQCNMKASDGSKFCLLHGGNKGTEKKEEASKRLYRLAKWQGRVEEIADHQGVKSLREEIGVLRMMLEETVLRCSDQTELLLYSSKISDLVMKIEKVVSSCHRLEASTGMLLDKAAALHLASVMVEIISEYVIDDAAIDAITNKIVVAIANQQSEFKTEKNK